MRSLQIQDHDWDDDDTHARASAASPVTAAALEEWVPCARWSDGSARVNWPCAGAALGFSAALLAALMTANIVAVPFLKREPTVVKLIELPVDPPEVPPPPQEAKVEPVKMVQPVIVAPKPIIDPPLLAPSPIQAAPEPPPVRATIVAPPQARPAGPVSVGDLASKMVSATPPKYPIESRKKHEQGTVVLVVTLSTAGSVSDIAVSRSSGSDRLDKAALAAVRRWKWSPTLVNGQPVQVRGIVEIPFVLQG